MGSYARRFRRLLNDPYRIRLWRLRLGNYATTILISFIALFVLITVILFFWYSRELPSPDRIVRKEGFSTLILDRQENPLYDIYTDQNRIPIGLKDIPEYLKQATVAIEDKDFYKHQGFDPKGILRAIFNTITFRGIQGGSTLTQQLVKNVLLTQERTLPRKIKEFILAVQIERKYSKDEILQMYLNEAPYGGTMWGIESAAQGYFGKHAKDLTLTESAILAGLPQRPSYYSPFNNEEKAYIGRAEEVLRRMKQDGYIKDSTEFEVRKELKNVTIATPGAQLKAAHFVLYVKKLLIEMFGQKKVEEEGLRVVTTVDGDLQSTVEKIAREELLKIKNLKVSNAAVLVTHPQTGEILAYLGSRDYESEEENFQGKYDVVSMGLRQPGSALKPITYAVAFTKGYTPSSLLMDVETHFPGGALQKDYIPKNYDNKFRGPIQIRMALANSINVPAVKMTALVGIKDILKTSYDLGLSTLAPTDKNVENLGLSLTLGGGEVKLLDLVPAYGVFATGGIKNELVSILKVTDNTGKTLYVHKKTAGKRVLGQDVSFLISDILSDNQGRRDVFGERSYLYIPGRTVAVKTGTTDDKRDNWTVGFTPSVAVGVWVGNNDNSEMDPRLASGATGASPIWNRVIREALKNKDDEKFIMPDNLVTLTIDAYGGGLPKDGKSQRAEYFIKGTEPTAVSPIYKKLKLSKGDNDKLANAVEIANGSYDEKEFIVFEESDPTSRDSQNRWQEGIDKWLELQSDPSFHSPSETSNKDENNVVVKIKKPYDKEKVDSNSVQITAEAKAIKKITKMELYIDGSLKTKTDDDVLDETVNLATGIHKIKVKAYDEQNRSGESEITIGVKTSADPPTLIPTPFYTPTPSPTP